MKKLCNCRGSLARNRLVHFLIASVRSSINFMEVFNARLSSNYGGQSSLWNITLTLYIPSTRRVSSSVSMIITRQLTLVNTFEFLQLGFIIIHEYAIWLTRCACSSYLVYTGFSRTCCHFPRSRWIVGNDCDNGRSPRDWICNRKCEHFIRFKANMYF